MGVDADAADAADLEERQDEVVVPRVEVETGLVDDAACLRRDPCVACFTAATFGISRQRRDRRRLDVDDARAAGCCRRRSAGR